MDIRRLEAYLAVLDHGGFSAAARAVHRSQPALSQAVRELEDELGTELFSRLGRRTVPTPAGRALEPPARQALRDVATARAAVAAVVGLEGGTLALCSLPTLAADPLADLVGRFRTAHPDVGLTLAAPEVTAELSDLVRTGACELGLTEEAARSDDLAVVPLGSQDLVVVFPPGRAPGGARFTLDRLGGVPLVTSPPGTSVRRLLDEGLAAAGVTPLVAVEAAQREAILPLVVAGAGAALVPEALGRLAVALGAEVARPHPPVRRPLALVHRPGPLAPAARAFVELAAVRAGR